MDKLESRNVVEELRQFYDISKWPPHGLSGFEHRADHDTLGFGLIHYAFLRTLRPQVALCIGSRHGYIPACMALALRDNEQGRLQFVDANFSPDDNPDRRYGGEGNWSRPVEEVFAGLDLYKYVDMFVMTTDRFFSTTDSTYMYAYIDGDHSYNGSKYDLSCTLPRMEPGGLIAMHDWMVKDYGIMQTISEHKDKVMVCAWPGLAILQRGIGL